MKKTIFFVLLFSNIFVFGNCCYANTFHSETQCVSNIYFSQNNQLSLTTDDQNIVIIEDSDLDLDEEYQSGYNVRTGNINKNFLEKNNLINSKFSKNFNLSIPNNCCNFSKAHTFLLGNSYPIYITQRVLKI